MNPMTNMKNVKKLSEQELQRNFKTSWHDQYKDSAWIFVGGLPFDLTEGDIICVFSQYGEIVNINLVRDKDSGKPRGFCFICYEDQRSTVLAVDNLNGIKILKRTIRVDHVNDYKMPKDNKNADTEIKKLQEEGCAPKPVLPIPIKELPDFVKKEEKPPDGFRLPPRLPIGPIKIEDEEGSSKKAKKDKKPKKQKKNKKKKSKKKHKKRSSSSSSQSDDNDSSSSSSDSSDEEKKNKTPNEIKIKTELPENEESYQQIVEKRQQNEERRQQNEDRRHQNKKDYYQQKRDYDKRYERDYDKSRRYQNINYRDMESTRKRNEERDQNTNYRDTESSRKRNEDRDNERRRTDNRDDKRRFNERRDSERDYNKRHRH